MSCDRHDAGRRWLTALGVTSPEATDAEVERHTFQVGTSLSTTVEAFSARLRRHLNGREAFVIVEIHEHHVHANVQLSMGDEVITFVVDKEEDMNEGPAV